MTSQPHTAAGEPRRRPTPPRPAAAAQYASFAPVTYVPDTYDPKQVAAVQSSLPGQFGIVYPTHHTGRAVWVVLALLVTTVISFVGWRAQHSGASDSSSGVTYTSPAGHFAAHFPAQPTETARSVQDGAAHVQFHTVGVPGAAVVVSVAVTGRLPRNAVSRLRAFVIQRITNSSLDLTSVRGLTFHGAPARQGNLVQPTGDVLSVLVVAPSARRYYLIGAPFGAEFNALKDSFRILP